MNFPNFKVVLYAPEIPGNTGSIGRTCVALNLELILIKPYGFDIDEKAVRRAGLDYWKHLNLTEYESWDEFLQKERPEQSQLLFFENDGEKNYFQAPFQENSYLIFGNETKGLPKDIYSTYPQNMYYMPMNSEHIRSLNLSNAATACIYHGLFRLNN